jgi:acyl-CoA thioester hydrolase
MPLDPFPQGHPFLHRCEHRVIYRDTDLAGHVYYGNYLTYFEVGRGAYLRSLGASYRDWEKRGYIIVVRAATVEYFKPAYYDDLLIIETRLTKLTPVQLAFAYRILREPEGGLNADGTNWDVLTTGTTRHPLLRTDRTVSRDGLKLMGELGVKPEDIPAELL